MILHTFHVSLTIIAMDIMVVLTYNVTFLFPLLYVPHLFPGYYSIAASNTSFLF
jgi:hypothetical protein